MRRLKVSDVVWVNGAEIGVVDMVLEDDRYRVRVYDGTSSASYGFESRELKKLQVGITEDDEVIIFDGLRVVRVDNPDADKRRKGR